MSSKDMQERASGLPHLLLHSCPGTNTQAVLLRFIFLHASRTCC
jgi:hypothetical protein